MKRAFDLPRRSKSTIVRRALDEDKSDESSKRDTPHRITLMEASSPCQIRHFFRVHSQLAELDDVEFAPTLCKSLFPHGRSVCESLARAPIHRSSAQTSSLREPVEPIQSKLCHRPVPHGAR